MARPRKYPESALEGTSEKPLENVGADTPAKGVFFSPKEPGPIEVAPPAPAPAAAGATDYAAQIANLTALVEQLQAKVGAAPTVITDEMRAGWKEAPRPKIEDVNFFQEPIKLEKGYRPANPFYVMERENPDDPNSPLVKREPLGEHELLDEKNRVMVSAKGEYEKLLPNTIVMLELNEARKLLNKRKAVLADVSY